MKQYNFDIKRKNKLLQSHIKLTNKKNKKINIKKTKVIKLTESNK